MGNRTRITSNEEATISLVSVDEKFECFGLEDQHQKEKVYGETRIPAGEYKVGVRTEGGFHRRYTRRFPDTHRGMLHILDVPGFEYALIHIGNDDDDTAGCLLVGVSADSSDFRGYSVGSSARAYDVLYRKVIGAAEDGELTIEFIDGDR